MEKTNLLTLVVTLTVGIILAGSLLMPVLSDATTTEKTYTNEGLIYLDKVDDSYEQTISWDYTTPDKITIGTDVLDLPKDAPIAVTFMANEDFFARWYYSGTDGSTSFIQVYTTNTASSYNANAANSQSMTITISNGSILFDNGTATTKTISYADKEMYCIAKDGDYSLKAPTTTAYLLDDSEVFAYGGTFTANLTFYTLIEGTPSDGFTRIIWPDTLPMTYTDMTDDLADVNGYVGLHTLKEFKYNITNTNTSTTRTVTYSQFIVPKEVTAELSQHLDAGSIALLNALPILVIIGLVLAGVGAIYVRNRD